MHFEAIPGNTMHHLQHSIYECPRLAVGVILSSGWWAPKTNFKPIWMNKLDIRQESHLEGSSNESHLGQAMRKKQKLSVQKQCISGDEKAVNIATTRKPVLPRTARLSQSSLPSHVPRGFPSCSPADAVVLISFSVPCDSSGISTCSCQHTPSHPTPTPRQINPR